MNFEQSKQKLEALASGLDPTSGLQLPDDSVYISPDIIRALYVAIKALDAAGRTQNRQRRAPSVENAGKTWSEAEEVTLLHQFDQGVEPIEIAKSLKRTLASIRARLCKNGRISEGSFPPRSNGGAVRITLRQD